MTTPAQSPARWYRQPILWLGAVLFAASLAGCIWLIVVSQRYADEPVPNEDAVFKVPLAPTIGEDPSP